LYRWHDGEESGKYPLKTLAHDMGRGCKLDRKIVANIFQKPLDKPFGICYNNITIKERLVFKMKATGIVRRIDDLGRVVIPKEIRRNLGIREGDPLEIFTEGRMVSFVKYSPLGEFAEGMKTVINTLTKRGIECAIYDNSNYKLMGDRNAPEEMEFDPSNECMFPINVDGEYCGYLAVAGMVESERAVINYAAEVLEEMMAV
jgi:AbrB family looped-hinge helix DNA binding protein